MFDGPYNDPNGYHKSVAGFFDLSLKDSVCVSGGNTGIHCGLTVTSLSGYHNDGHGPFRSIEAINPATLGVAACFADSGSPVLVPYTGGVYVGAAGMVQYGAYPVETFPIPDSWTGLGQGDCFGLVGFTSMRTIVRDLGSGAGLWTFGGVAYP